MPIDWVGVSITAFIILAIILIVIAKMQGDKVVDVLGQILDFMKGNR
jgi:hypothetical protein